VQDNGIQLAICDYQKGKVPVETCQAMMQMMPI
jgi:hypothetical protein